MIPKIIHYCWFGENSLSPLNEKCILTWKEKLPDYEIKLWNEHNIPKENEYVNRMLAEKKYAFVADYIRFYALYNEGGIYLDTDMEVVKSFDDLLNQKCFLGYESKEYINAAIVGGVKFFELFTIIMSAIEENYNQTKEVETIPKIITKTMKKDNLFSSDIRLYPTEYFYPFNPYDNTLQVKTLMYMDITENTYTIHHWEKSWKVKKNIYRKLVDKFKKKIKNL